MSGSLRNSRSSIPSVIYFNSVLSEVQSSKRIENPTLTKEKACFFFTVTLTMELLLHVCMVYTRNTFMQLVITVSSVLTISNRDRAVKAYWLTYNMQGRVLKASVSIYTREEQSHLSYLIS